WRIAGKDQEVFFLSPLDTSGTALNTEESRVIQRCNSNCVKWRKAVLHEILYCFVIGKSGNAASGPRIKPEYKPATRFHKISDEVSISTLLRVLAWRWRRRW